MNTHISLELAIWLKKRGCDIESKLYWAKSYLSKGGYSLSYSKPISGDCSPAYSWYDILVTHAKEFFGEVEEGPLDYNPIDITPEILTNLQHGNFEDAEAYVRKYSLFAKQSPLPYFTSPIIDTFTKQQVEEVIEKLVDKSLTQGCCVLLEPHDYVYSGPHIITSQQDETYTAYAQEYSLNHDMKQTVSLRPLCAGRAIVIKQVLGHPILKGTVAKKLAIKYRDEEFPDRKTPTLGDYANSFSSNILGLWERCEKEDEELSLQEIAGRIEWEEVCKGCGFTEWKTKICCPDHPGVDPEKRTVRIAKPSPETDLLLFLKSLTL